MRTALAVLAALAIPTGAHAADALILHETQLQPREYGWHESWTDQRHDLKRLLEYDPHGKLERQFVTTLTGCTRHEEDVDYRARVWRSITVTIPGAKRCTSGAGLYPADIRKGLSDGTLSVLGRKRGVVHLEVIPHGLTWRHEVWVRDGSYRVIRDAQRSLSGGRVITSSRYDWLPASAAKLATLRRPKGFRHLRCNEQIVTGPVAHGTGRLTPVCR